MAPRTGFSLEAWVTTGAVANRYIVGRARAWDLETNFLGHWGVGLFSRGRGVKAYSKALARADRRLAALT